MNTLVILIIVLFIIYYITSKYELFEGEVVENAYSNMFCLDDSLPLTRFIENKTFQCISRDGTNCATRDTLAVPSNVICTKVNEYLSKDGIRDIKSQTRAVFDEFESGKNNNMKLFTCNRDALSDPTHWCGKLWNKLNTQECNRPDAQFRPYANQCKNIKTFLTTPLTGQKVSIKNNADIQLQKAAQKAASNIIRARGR